jgi:hypothetical protein
VPFAPEIPEIAVAHDVAGDGAGKAGQAIGAARHEAHPHVAHGPLRSGFLESRHLGALLAAAAMALAVGASSGRPGGIVLVAAAFAAFQVATVVAGTRLQDRITGPARATVTSVASLATDGLTIAVYGTYALLAPAGHGVAFAVLAAPYVLVAALIAGGSRRAPRRDSAPGL